MRNDPIVGFEIFRWMGLNPDQAIMVVFTDNVHDAKWFAAREHHTSTSDFDAREIRRSEKRRMLVDTKKGGA